MNFFHFDNSVHSNLENISIHLIFRLQMFLTHLQLISSIDPEGDKQNTELLVCNYKGGPYTDRAHAWLNWAMCGSVLNEDQPQ